jgi:hypothetical protein
MDPLVMSSFTINEFPSNPVDGRGRGSEFENKEITEPCNHSLGVDGLSIGSLPMQES